MTKFLNFLLHHATRDDLHQFMVRSHAIIDGGDGIYSILREQEYNLDVVSSGGVIIFMLHLLLTR